MKLNPGERSILASFASGPQAEEALNRLRQAGYSEAQMDRLGRTGYQPDVFENRPAALAGKETSQVRAVLGPEQMDDDTAVLLGASTEVSGLSAPDAGDDYPFLVTIVTNNSGVDQAVSIIQELGGRV